MESPSIAGGFPELTLASETEKFWSGAPGLAVEVLSPSDTVYEVDEKVATWLSSDKKRVWVVNPKLGSIHVHCPGGSIQTLEEGDVLDGQDIIPRLRLSLAELFS